MQEMNLSYVGDMPKGAGPEGFVFSWGCQEPRGPFLNRLPCLGDDVGVSETGRLAPLPHSPSSFALPALA